MVVQLSTDFGDPSTRSQGLISELHAALELQNLSTRASSQVRRDGVASKGSFGA